MGTMETAFVLSPYCRYSILSEDFESGLGWSYTKWLKKLEKDPGIPTPLIGRQIVDSVITANENDIYGDSTTMALINEAAVPELMDAWIDFAYENSDNLLSVNYSRLHKAKGRSTLSNLINDWGSDNSDVTMADYYVSDILAIAESSGAKEEKKENLKNALKRSITYFGHTSDRNELTGLAVSLPYGDAYFYERLSDVYSKCGIDKNYVAWLENFVGSSDTDNYNNYEEFEDSWGGWACYGGGCHSEESAQEDSGDDWTYDYEEEIWYLYEDGILYLYDDENDELYYYDETYDLIYVYDESDDNWYAYEE